jgi:vancomycin resistance protein VanW
MSSLPIHEIPSRLDVALFAARACGLRLLRLLREAFSRSRAKRHLKSGFLTEAPIIAQISSPLWTTAGGPKEHALTAGKVENLRVALRHIDGVALPPGEMFSFWRQCGPPWRVRGFVPGRELREGCMVPAAGGGLCQLSNALFRAASSAQLEIVERHAHSRVVSGSRAAIGDDARVFWNYVDLRFRAPYGLRIEGKLTHDHLVVTLRAAPVSIAASPVRAPESPAVSRAEANDCLTCPQIACRRYDEEAAPPRPRSTAWLLDACTPEFSRYFSMTARANDALLIPTRRLARSRYAWPRGLCAREASADIAALRRSLAMRGAGHGGTLQARALNADADLAVAYARRLSPIDTHLVVAQNSLPHLWRMGALGGRRFSVAMTRLPMENLHAVLDEAARFYPTPPTRKQRDLKAGRFGRWLNPLGRWDWWELGGRFDGLVTGQKRSGSGSESMISSGPDRGRDLIGGVVRAFGGEPTEFEAEIEANIDLVSSLLHAARRKEAHAFPTAVVLPVSACKSEFRWLDSLGWRPIPEETKAILSLPDDATFEETATAAYEIHAETAVAGIAYHF